MSNHAQSTPSPRIKTKPVTARQLYEISSIFTAKADWKEALEDALPFIRKIMVYDVFSVYLADPATLQLEIGYARAAGRGKNNAADLEWGSRIALQIMENPRTIYESPDHVDQNRLDSPFILGAPLLFGSQPLGALVFVRFGGPRFNRTHIRLVEFLSRQLAMLVDKKNLSNENQLLRDRYNANQLQDDFLATVSHELRTPLGFIKGYTTTLLRSDTSWEPDEQREFLTIIDQEADRLEELIRNVLDSARLQAGVMQMALDSIRLDSLMESVIQHTAQHEPGFRANLETNPPAPTIKADPKRLAQVFENLFTNAIKYAPGSPVWVRIEQNHDGCIIIIEDEGPGLSPEKASHLFERFYRNPETAIQQPGTGLGLYICQKIIQAHQGSINVTSELGKGTRFTIHLPEQAA